MSPKPAATLSVSWILRIGVAMEFIGHGMLGFSHPPAWASYFGVVGIGRESAHALMPWVGIADIATGVAVLIYPCKAMVWYMALWGLWTSVLRPLAGESVWEAVERAGNYGAPLALFLLTTGSGPKAWLGATLSEPEAGSRRQVFRQVLRLTTVLLLLGHGMLGLLVHKPLYGSQYAHIGFPSPLLKPTIGTIECLLAAAVLLKPVRALLIGVVLWKLSTEALNPIAGSPIWVFIEHGGSYAAPLALALMAGCPEEVPQGRGAVAYGD